MLTWEVHTKGGDYIDKAVIERAKALGLDVEEINGFVDVEGSGLQGTYPDTAYGQQTLTEDLNKLVETLRR